MAAKSRQTGAHARLDPSEKPDNAPWQVWKETDEAGEGEYRMKIEELKRVKDRRPFQPFLIHVADGRSFEVRHPDAVSWGAEGGRILSYVSPRDEWELIDIALVTSLGSVPAASPADQGTDENGA